jgi:hypothetical protein
MFVKSVIDAVHRPAVNADKIGDVSGTHMNKRQGMIASRHPQLACAVWGGPQMRAA